MRESELVIYEKGACVSFSWASIARVSRWEFKNSLSWKRDVWERHGGRDFLVKGEGRKRKREGK
jgi:hypothetical protein